MTTDRIAEIRKQLELNEAYHCGWSDEAVKAVRDLLDLVERQQKVVEAARSVCSEDSVREELLCYVMGAELLDRLAALEGK